MTDNEEPAGADGYSTGEKVVGAAAAFSSPILTGAAAAAALSSESDPTKRRQLTLLRNGSLIWAGAGLVSAVVAVILVVSFSGSSDRRPGGPVDVGSVSGKCQGKPVDFTELDLTTLTYESDDDVHWTATVPCTGGGATAVPVPADEVPGAR